MHDSKFQDKVTSLIARHVSVCQSVSPTDQTVSQSVVSVGVSVILFLYVGGESVLYAAKKGR